MFRGEVNILRLIDGARAAEGTAVIIDVFRAFSVECTLYALGAREVRPVGGIEEACAWRKRDPECVLVGERKGVMCEGFDFGNSPSAFDARAVAGRRIIHTTSAGTQGLVNATRAREILTGSLMNARAIAEYIRTEQPFRVSLVCMGKLGLAPAEEDELCAVYIESLLREQPFPELEARLDALRVGGGRHFFDPDNQAVFPEADFWHCIRHDVCPFVLKVERDADGLIARRIDVL